jgi:multidrug resistance efflux pump
VAKLSEKLATNQPPDVSQDEVLIELTNSTLDFEMTRVTGELQTGRKKLSTTQSERVSVDRNDPRGRSKLEQLAAEEKELEETLKSLAAQLEILKRQQAELQLRSPINGQVLTWDVTQLLQNRPVRQGDRLLEVADTRGEWNLEVHVADQNIGYVRDARRELGNDLDVSFVVATDPNVVYHGRLKSMAADTRSDSELGPSVLVTVSLPKDELSAEHLRPGATVIPHIHCGRRPVGYVWFHELIHTIKTKLFF